jgi:tripartite-type tricarboxylate transporter receptor subunit TctC
MHRKLVAGLLAATGLMAIAATAHAQDVASFFTGKQLKLMTASTSGGGYDAYARLLARHMSRHIPGNPTIVVQNMPGGQGVTAANYLYNKAPRDGTVFAGLQRKTGLTSFYLPEHKAVKFDPRKFIWLGSPQQEVGFLLVRTATGVKTLADLKRLEVTASSTTRNSPNSIYARLLNALYGSKIKVVEGYKGSQTALFALEREEVGAPVSGVTGPGKRLEK